MFTYLNAVLKNDKKAIVYIFVFVFSCASCKFKNGIKPMDGESKTVRLYIGQEGEFSNIMINRINDGDWQLQLVFIGLNPVN